MRLGTLLREQRRVRGRRPTGGQQGHNLAELQGRVAARRQCQFRKRARHGERDIDTARFGFEIDIEDGLDLHRVIKRDAPLAQCVLGAEKCQLALGDVDAPQHRRIAGRAAQTQVGLRLQVLRQ